MDNFLIREMSGSTSELLIKENKSKFTPQKEASPAAKTKETRSVEEMAPDPSEVKRPETPSTSTLKHITKGRRLFSYVEIWKSFHPHDVRINRQHL